VDTRPAKAPCTFQGFADPVVYTPALAPYSLHVADIDGDGHPDFLVTENHNWTASIELFRNTGKGAFVPSDLPVGLKPNTGLVIADFNGDGFIDLANQSNSAQGLDLKTDDGVIALDFATAPGKFSPQAVTLASPQANGLLSVGDFDGDGRPDLAFAGYDEVETKPFLSDSGGLSLPGPAPTHFALNLYRNGGQGALALAATYANSTLFSNLVTGDFDGDGHRDIAGLAGLFGVFYNTGDGTFGDEVTVGANPDWGGFGLGVADFNGDGIDDLTTATILKPNASDESIVIEVWLGARDRTFTRVTTEITAVPDTYEIATGDFNGDGKPDVALALSPPGRGGNSPPIPVAIYENRGDGTFAAPVITYLRGKSEPLTNAIAAGDFNGDGVTDLVVATTGRFEPYPVTVNVLLSRCQ